MFSYGLKEKCWIFSMENHVFLTNMTIIHFCHVYKVSFCVLVSIRILNRRLCALFYAFVLIKIYFETHE